MRARVRKLAAAATLSAALCASAAALGQKEFVIKPRPGGAVVRFVLFYVMRRYPREIHSYGRRVKVWLEDNAALRRHVLGELRRGGRLRPRPGRVRDRGDVG